MCTEDICDDPNTQFTHAFSSEIDLKAHKAKMHTKNMSKLQSREARSIDVNFQFQPRRQGYGGRGKKISSYFAKKFYSLRMNEIYCYTGFSFHIENIFVNLVLRIECTFSERLFLTNIFSEVCTDMKP